MTLTLAPNVQKAKNMLDIKIKQGEEVNIHHITTVMETCDQTIRDYATDKLSYKKAVEVLQACYCYDDDYAADSFETLNEVAECLRKPTHSFEEYEWIQ